MSWGEAYRLVGELASDPTSHTAAALGGWEHPFSREAALLADLFDLTHLAHASDKGPRPKPYPRPWPRTDVVRRGSTVGHTPDEIRAELARMSGRSMS